MGKQDSPEVALVAFGGCGNNIARHFQGRNSAGMQFVQVDDDRESLDRSAADIKLTYADCKDDEKVGTLFPRLRLFFLVGGLGGSSCGHMPELARTLTKRGALGIGLLTTPFAFENRQEKADRDLEAIAQEIGRVCIFSNSVRKGEATDSQILARRMRDQAEGMWLCIDAMTNGRADPDRYDPQDLDRLISTMRQETG